MAHQPKEVRVKDVKQGRTFWLVDVVIVDVMAGEKRQELMKRYPHEPERWASDDAWGRARVRKPQQLFVHDRRDILEELSCLFETSKCFFRYNDAFEYYWMVAGVLAQKTLELEARFPIHINPAKNWIGKDSSLVLAKVPLDPSMIPNGLKINR